MKYIIALMLLISSGYTFSVDSTVYSGVTDCRSYPAAYVGEFDLGEEDIKYPQSIEDVVLHLLRKDLSAKIGAVSMLFPSDYPHAKGNSYKVKLNAYKESRFEAQAICLSDLYKSDDSLFFFEQDQSLGSYYSGFVLMRNNKPVAVAITGGIQI